MQERIVLIKINQVVGYLYLPSHTTAKAAIHAKGGPSFGDSGSSALWPIAKRYDRILFTPDYIGYCRSDGRFSFHNCVETIYESERFLRGEVHATVIGTDERIVLTCTDIVIVGSSWGAAIVTFLEKYQHSSIRDIALVKGVTDWLSLGNGDYPEENAQETSRSIKEGWKNVYRGYSTSLWPKIFHGQLGEYNPISNVHLLKGKRLYIAHGDNDTSINWRRSKLYYQKALNFLPKGDVSWCLLPTGHTDEANALGLEFMLEKLARSSNIVSS